MKKRVLYIINPISGVGKQKIIEQLLLKHNNNDNIDYTIRYTEFAGHGTAISKEESTNYNAIIAVGGDGSINEIAKSLINPDTAFGMIPTGSGNGFARHLEIPLKLANAIQVINDFKTVKIDTASINDNYFVNVAGVDRPFYDSDFLIAPGVFMGSGFVIHRYVWIEE